MTITVEAMKANTLELFGHKGWAEWSDSKECLHLYWWLVNAKDNTFVVIDCLVPHGQDPLGISEELTELHIQGAIAMLKWMKEQNFPNGFIPSGRGYERFDLIPESTAWSDDSRFWAEVIVNNRFDSFLTGRLHYPRCLARLVNDAIKPQVDEWIASLDVQSYLKSKAENMADFWCDRIGMPGSSGNTIADMLHLIDISQQSGVREPESQQFRRAMIDDIMQSFSNRRIPFYDTDYGIGRNLKQVLEKSGLLHLQSRFPWKTWRHFDFSDAPKFQLKLN